MATTVLPPAPPEPARQNSFSDIAPGFALRLHLLIQDLNSKGLHVGLFEGLRTAERQEWLYAQGRTFRGAIVTNARTIWNGWHGYGCAGDLAFISGAGEWYWPSDASKWNAIADAAPAYGLVTGAKWRSWDGPHVQPGAIKVTPSSQSKAAFDKGGLPEVWRITGQLRMDADLLAMVRNGRLG